MKAVILFLMFVGLIECLQALELKAFSQDNHNLFALEKTSNLELFNKNYKKIENLINQFGEKAEHLYFTGEIIKGVRAYGMWYKEDIFLFEVLHPQGNTLTVILRAEPKNRLSESLKPVISKYLTESYREGSLTIPKIPKNPSVDLLPFDFEFYLNLLEKAEKLYKAGF